MFFATVDDTQRFLSVLWIRWGESILNHIASHYELNTEQRDALYDILLRPNDWVVHVGADPTDYDTS